MNEFEIAVVNEPSVFEPLKFYCNKISPMKFCYNTSFTFLKQFQRSRSILLDRSRFLGLFWKEKTRYYHRRNTVCGVRMANLQSLENIMIR